MHNRQLLFWLTLKEKKISTSDALEALCDYALYKSTFTLHYIKQTVTINH